MVSNCSNVSMYVMVIMMRYKHRIKNHPFTEIPKYLIYLTKLNAQMCEEARFH